MQITSYQSLLRAGLYVIVAILYALLVAWNVLALTEYYGDGPPYYSRTTNMDKWTNPIPLMTVVDSIGALIIGGILYLMRRTR
ncbi:MULTISPECIES: hypothetical protein [unclassified Caballeronia]|uniref:hypothetical protein n=1 Tax=unclassified Caballeronia TaxID=2646786 RepID=UPI002859FBE3|nr:MULTISPECIES: hypothetical protein [unclassified Caballeronia]MDR5813403.1 hypothetical protein [Caballeronia sp. LZ033]MDR5820160.1 hypothetical protein [Caballeronia sp. LZ043]